jgi:N4-gp56 family major capsid protein
MAGQLWSAANGYLATPTLSETLRNSVQPISRFMQFCDVEAAIGKNNGEQYTWNIYSDVADTSTDTTGISENAPMPESNFNVTQGSLTVKEFGLAVPYSGKYDDLSEQPVKEIINKSLKNHAARTLDKVAAAQFDASILTATSTSATAFTLQDNGAFSGVATHALSKAHIRAIGVEMEERNIPTYDGENYVSVMRPATFDPIGLELEGVHQYTAEGWNMIMNGEKGRYNGFRFVNQTNVASKGWTNTDAAYFFGADTVTEAVACPLELRGKIADDYGRGKGIAWYYLGNFGITHADTTSAETKAQARIIRWGSTS